MNRRRRRRERLWLDSLRGHLMHGGCSDCTARWSVSMDDSGEHCLHIWHCPTCPAAAGVVTWRPSQAATS